LIFLENEALGVGCYYAARIFYIDKVKKLENSNAKKRDGEFCVRIDGIA